MISNFRCLIITICISLAFSSATYGQSSAQESLSTVTSHLSSIFSPLPSFLIEDLSISYGYIGHQTTLTNLTSMGLSSFGVMYGSTISFMYPFFYDGLTLGFESCDVSRGYTNEPAANQFQTTRISYSYLQLLVRYEYYSESNLTLSTFAGYGTTKGSYSLSSFSETLPSSYTSLHRAGSSPSYQVGLEASYNLNPVWSFSSSVSYFSANIKTLTNNVGREVVSEPLTLEGARVELSTTIGL